MTTYLGLKFQNQVKIRVISNAIKEQLLAIKVVTPDSGNNRSVPGTPSMSRHKCSHQISDSEDDYEPRFKIPKPGENTDAQEDPESFMGRSDSKDEAQEDGEDMLDDFAQEVAPNEDVGEPAPEKLANMVSSILKTRLKDEKLKQLIESVPKPNNILMLATPHVHSTV